MTSLHPPSFYRNEFSTCILTYVHDPAGPEVLTSPANECGEHHHGMSAENSGDFLGGYTSTLHSAQFERLAYFYTCHIRLAIHLHL